MKIVEQYQCPDCYGLHDDKIDAQSCCVPNVRTVFVFENGEYYSDEKDAIESIYLKELQNGLPPLEAREIADKCEVVRAD